MLRNGRRPPARKPGVRNAGILVAALLTMFVAASSARAQMEIPGPGFCPVGSCDGGGGDAGESINNGDGGGGDDGNSGTGTNSGSDGADDVAGSDQGQPGASGVGTPGRSGRPSPTPLPTSTTRSTSPAGGRTTPSGSTTSPSGSRGVQEADSDVVLAFNVIESPFPALEPSPSPSPTDSDILAVEDLPDPDPTPAAEEGASWLPLLAVILGIALLIMFLRGRSKRSKGRSNRRVSGDPFR